MRELPADSASPMLTSLVTFLFSDKKVTPIVLGNGTTNTNLKIGILMLKWWKEVICMKFPEIREIRTARLILRKVRLEDAGVYFRRIGSREAVTRYMLWNPHKDVSESVASMEKALRRYGQGRCYRWGIVLPEDDSIIGIMELLRFDEEKETCSFAYMLSDDFWGRGYGTEALKAALDFAFREMEVKAVEADHFAVNEASGAVMRKAGMKYVGTENGKYEKNGILHDAYIYRIENS